MLCQRTAHHALLTAAVLSVLNTWFASGLIAQAVSREAHSKMANGTCEQLQLVDDLVRAFNDHSPSKMAACLSEDCEIFYVDERGRCELGTQGVAALQAEMRSYFDQLSTVKSRLVQKLVVGRFVTAEERVEWNSGGAVRSQSSLAIFETNDPAQK